MGDVEIQEEAELQAREFQVSQELSVVYGKEAFDGLHFYDQALIHH